MLRAFWYKSGPGEVLIISCGSKGRSVCTLPMVPCGVSPVSRFALASAMRKTRRLRRRLGQWLSRFDSCQLTILWMSYIKDVDLPRHAWDTPPFLLIVSPTPPIQSVDACVRTYVRTYERTYARSVTWQPNEKRLTIFHGYGALSHARFARAGAPLQMSTTQNLHRSQQLLLLAEHHG